MNHIIEEMPKVVLHLHLDGSLRPETVQKWLKEDGTELDLEEVKKRLMVNKDCKNLNEYLEKFDIPSQVLQTKERLKQSTYELFEDLAKQNVIYAEVRFAPSKHLEKGLQYDDVVEAAIEGMEEAKQKYGIQGNLILCCMRGDGDKNEQDNLQTVKAAKKYLNKGVCALDLAGAEALFPTEDFENIFRIARKENIPFTIHAGEAAGPESIKKAIRFGAKRIGHGIRCIEDQKLMEILKIGELVLEVCPISNLQTQAVEGEHPLEKLYNNGIKTTISPDNNTVSNTDILQEYEWILENTKLEPKDLLQMSINAARGAFAPLPVIANLIHKVVEYKNKIQNIGENSKNRN